MLQALLDAIQEAAGTVQVARTQFGLSKAFAGSLDAFILTI